MLKSLFIFLLATVSSTDKIMGGPEPPTETSTNKPFKTFSIDMDADPKDRFNGVVQGMKEPMMNSYEAVFSIVPESVIDLFELTHWWWFFIHNERYMELVGITEALDEPEITVAKMVLVNCIYELTTWCTSIITKMADGTIIHSRNLDFKQPEYMKSVTFHAEFRRKGELVYEAMMFAGNVGIYTGMKPNAFSIAQNTRAPVLHANNYQREENYWGMIENLSMLFTGFKQQSWIIREVLAECNDYDCAHEILRDEPFTAPGFISLAGIKDEQGVVIARDRFKTLMENFLDSYNGKWYLVQANLDHWIDGCIERCASAESDLLKIGRDNVNVELLRKQVFEVYPVLNSHTLYNTNFIPSQGYMNTTREEGYGYYSKEFVSSPIVDYPKFDINEAMEGVSAFKFVSDLVATTQKMAVKAIEQSDKENDFLGNLIRFFN